MANNIVVVTGGSGYIASWVCHYLIQSGFHVRATCRSISDEKTSHLSRMGVEVVGGCDLLEDGSFDEVSLPFPHFYFHLGVERDVER